MNAFKPQGGVERGITASRRIAERTAMHIRNLARWRAQLRAIDDLRQLDDRTLRDIGIDRSQIESIVRGHMTIYRGARSAAPTPRGDQ